MISVIIRSRDEADRLRLTLTALAGQSAPAECIVVNDGSLDHTAAVLAEAAKWFPFKVVHHALPRGRSGAANAGAGLATGDILLFLDGDTLAGPELVARHAALHASGGLLIGRGETFHLRCTRFLRDPETGIPWPGEAPRLARLPPGESARLRVTRHDVSDNFAGLERRAEPGVYPGAGPRLLYQLEMDALRHNPDCAVLWAAASGANLSVPRRDFLRARGFDEQLDLNEHRELALRLCNAGLRMVAVEGARTYHMTHRSGWRDPLRETAWEEIFYRAHPLLAVRLLTVFWASLSGSHHIPDAARINTLPELEIAARGDGGIDYDAVRRLIAATQRPGEGGSRRVSSAVGSA
jgi:GT2 family glycosyltransferase